MTKICRTNGAIYEITISPERVGCVVRLPPTASIFATSIQATEDRIHAAMEYALAPLFRPGSGVALAGHEETMANLDALKVRR